jgi:glycerophosphoryl diester phosphodiesterase
MKTVIVGHRGAPNMAPENTIPSFLKAIEIGVNIIELDVRRTGDGAIVVIHDDRVDRTTDGIGSVKDLTLDGIKKLDAGSWFSPAFKGTKVPTLEEALAAIDGKAVARIELKDGGLEEGISSLVMELGLKEEVEVASFELARIRKFRELCPAVPGVAISTAFESQFLHSSIESYSNAVAILVRRFGEADVFKTHVHGLTFDAWPVDDVTLARDIVSLRVDSITSNRPSEILKCL